MGRGSHPDALPIADPMEMIVRRKPEVGWVSAS